MYGLDGTRRLPEFTLDWLSGYEGSKPVRVGNAAAGQFQLDVWGEVLDGLHLAREVGSARTAPRGTFNARYWTSSKAIGAKPITACGRSAAIVVSSCTPR